MRYDPEQSFIEKHGRGIAYLPKDSEAPYRGPVMANSEDLYRLATDLLRITPDDKEGVLVCQKRAQVILAAIRSQQPAL